MVNSHIKNNQVENCGSSGSSETNSKCVNDEQYSTDSVSPKCSNLYSYLKSEVQTTNTEMDVTTKCKNMRQSNSTVTLNTNTSKPTNGKNIFKVFHQNIRGLKSKVDELSNSLLPDYPKILCLNEHHLKNFEIDNLPIDRF
jgi:hypothetical protein